MSISRRVFLSISMAGVATVAAMNLRAQGGVGLTPQQMEAAGLELGSVPTARTSPSAGPALWAPALGRVLLIPDSSADVVAMFDPFDGHFLGNLINGSSMFTTPINAVQGPDGNIYVSDQVADSVFVFDPSGTYLSTYADSTDGLNNIRGIDFFNGHLFVTSGDDYVAEFSGPHARLADFINDGSDPFDILFLPGGTSLLTDIQGDFVRYYSASGTLNAQLFAVNFPEQVQTDSLSPGDALESSFSDHQITDFDLAGTIHLQTPLSSSGRGVIRLGNGNLLSSGGAGVQELDPTNGNVLNQIMTGSSWRFIEEVNLSVWTDLGFALAGQLGTPELSADGSLSAGTTINVLLTNARPSSPAVLFLGMLAINVPFAGGTLVPSPDVLLALSTSPAGDISFSSVYPSGVPAGLPIYMQCWILDPTGPQGLTASNAITATSE